MITTKKYECSRCGVAFNKNDQDLLIRISRHDKGRHERHIVISERDGSESKPMGNFDYGPVEWKEIDD